MRALMSPYLQNCPNLFLERYFDSDQNYNIFCTPEQFKCYQGIIQILYLT